MNPSKTGLMITLSAALALVGAAAGAAPQLVAPDRLTVEDADTLLVEVAGTSHRIQLPGIDAPESRMNPKLKRDMARTGLGEEALLALGQAADAGLGALLPEFRPYRLRFDPDARDRYGRIPGDLLDAQGRTLSERLVEGGYAIPLTGAAEDSAALATAAASARAAGRGLWASHPETAMTWVTAVAAPQR